MKMLGREVSLKRLTAVDWAYVNFKLSLGLIWPIAFLSADSRSKMEGQEFFFWIWTIATTVGFFVSVTGLVLSAQKDGVRQFGYRLEMTGLWLFLTGPFTYLILTIGTYVSTLEPLRGAQVALAYALCAAIVARILLVRRAALRTLRGKAV